MAPRRNTRRHPQIHTSAQGPGMAPRRRHRQIQPSADGAGVNRRRSPRLHPQIHASEELGAGMARTSPAEAAASLPDENGRSEQGARVACLRPQIQPSDEDAGVTRSRSPPLQPQIHASEEVGAGLTRRVRRRRTTTSPVAADASLPDENGRSEQGARVACLRPQIQPSDEDVGVTRCRTGTSPATADASLPDDDDMLREILLRLPPQPSSLPRASAVCKRWLGLVTDPRFHRQFYAHHRKPPLLGVFSCSRRDGIVFDPILDPPDRIPPQRFSLGSYTSSWSWGFHVPMRVLDCRHGLLLLKNDSGTEVVVCDPITSEQLSLAIPPELRTDFLGGAVLCAASDLDHVHGGCYSSPFNLVLVSSGPRDSGRDLACVYSSETGVWGDLILTGAPAEIFHKPAVLVGNCLCWLSLIHGFVEFDLDEHSVAVIEGPPVTFAITYENSQIIQAEDGDVGFAAFSYPHFQMWRRNVNGQGVATWVHWKTIAMCTVLGLPSLTGRLFARLLGYDEDTDVLFLHVGDRVYMVQLKSMQSTKLHKMPYPIDQYYPFTSFYTPVSAAIADESNGAEIMHNT